MTVERARWKGQAASHRRDHQVSARLRKRVIAGRRISAPFETAQKYDGQRLRVFETWLTLDDLVDATLPDPSTLRVPPSSRRVPLRRLTQLRIRAEEREFESDRMSDAPSSL